VKRFKVDPSSFWEAQEYQRMMTSPKRQMYSSLSDLEYRALIHSEGLGGTIYTCLCRQYMNDRDAQGNIPTFSIASNKDFLEITPLTGEVKPVTSEIAGMATAAPSVSIAATVSDTGQITAAGVSPVGQMSASQVREVMVPKVEEARRVTTPDPTQRPVSRNQSFLLLGAGVVVALIVVLGLR